MTDLSQRALHRTQEVVILHIVQAAAVDVEQLEAQTLHFFKIKVQCEHLGVGGVTTAVDHLGASHLHTQHRKKNDGVTSCLTCLTLHPDRRTEGVKSLHPKQNSGKQLLYFYHFNTSSDEIMKNDE